MIKLSMQKRGLQNYDDDDDYWIYQNMAKYQIYLK